jgi:hypothetical protein
MQAEGALDRRKTDLIENELKETPRTKIRNPKALLNHAQVIQAFQIQKLINPSQE